VNGSLGKKLISDLIRDIGSKGSSGLLRVSSGKSIKAIFFEAGVPVYAISNVASEQIESILVNEGIASLEQIDAAKTAGGKSQKLGRALVEMGFVSEDDITRISVESARKIIFSLFELTRGDYIFDDRVRAAAHEVKLDWTVSDCLLEGGRTLARHEEMVGRLAPDDANFVKPKSTGRLVLAGKLNPTESYIYSRIDTTIQINELAMSTGLPEEECRRAIVALITLGMVKVEGKSAEGDEPVDEDPTDKIAEDVSKLIHFFANADYYEVLGVTLRSPAGEIKSAYYTLAKKYHPDRFRQPEQAELRSKVEALFAKVTEAYETLSDTPKRAMYDDRLRKGTPKRDQAPSIPIGSKAPTAAHAAAVPMQARGTGSLNPNGSSLPPASTALPVSDSNGSEAGGATLEEPEPSATKPATAAGAPVAPGVSAEFCYQQGKARLEQKDYYGSVQLLREAVRLDSSKAPYHFHLGMALMRNPRTRREGEQHLIRAAELDPFSAAIRIRLGLIYKEAGLAKKAEGYFREALKIDPENRAALKELNGGGKDDSPIWKSDLGSLAKRIFKK